MTLTNDQVVSTLNGLIETCHNGEEGFRNAAGKADEDHLKTLFNNYCQQRAQLAAELEQEVRRLGGDAETGGTVAGAVHRGLMNVKAAVTGSDDGTLLAECERGEDVAVEAYEDALNAALPANIKQVVSRQFAAIKAAHDRIRELEKTHVKAS